MLKDFISMMPLIISALLGSYSNDFILNHSSEKKEKLSLRFGKIFISTVITFAIVGFGASIFDIPNKVDWKVNTFVSFIIGFTGYRIGEFFTKSLGGLTIIGQSKLVDLMEIEKEKEILRKKKEEQNNDEKNVES